MEDICKGCVYYPPNLPKTVLCLSAAGLLTGGVYAVEMAMCDNAKVFAYYL